MARRYEPEMRQALAVAREVGLRGDIPMGAVVLGPDRSPIGVSGNERELTGDPAAYAEVVTTRRAVRVLGRQRPTGCTLVVTLEPYTMCASAIAAA